jgi:hypothetical protein
MPDKPVLTIELVPKPLWHEDLRLRLGRLEWQRRRGPCLEAAGHRCELCGQVGTKGRLDAHEVWRYDDQAHVQTLVRLICLCTACHAVKHWGHTATVGFQEEAVATLKRVNGWTDVDARQHVAAAFAEWGERSRYQWTQDLSVMGLPSRRRAARRRLTGPPTSGP